MSWFQVGTSGLIYQNGSERFRTFHKPLSGAAYMYKVCFYRVSKVFRLFITEQKYVNAELDKTEMLMNLKTERNQRK